MSPACALSEKKSAKVLEMTRQCAEHSSAFLGKGRLCLLTRSPALFGLCVWACVVEISGRKRSDPGFQDRAGWEFGVEGVGGVVGAGLENPDPLFPVRDFLNRNTWLLWPRAVSAAGPANLPSLFLRVMRKTPAYLHRRAGVWILSRRGLWGY